MEVEYNLELAQMILRGEVRGSFILPRSDARYGFKILTLDRLVDGMHQGFGMYRSGLTDFTVPFDRKTGESRGFKIVLDLHDFVKGDFVSYICNDGDLVVGILSGFDNFTNYATVSCQVNCSTNSIEESKLFFPIEYIRVAYDSEVTKFMEVISSKGYKLNDYKLEKINPEKIFSPFEKVLVHTRNKGWMADFFSKKVDEEYHTTAGRILSSEGIVPYNEETKHLLNQ